MFFFIHVSLLSAAQLAAGLAAFVYTLVAARILGVENYGLFQAVMAIYGAFSIVYLPLNMATIHCVGRAQSTHKALVAGELLKFALVAAAATCALLAALAPLLVHWLKASSALPILVTALLVAATIILTTFYGMLQAIGRYFEFSVIKTLEAIFTLGLGTWALSHGWQTAGAVFGYLASMSLVSLWFFTRGHLFAFRGGEEVPELEEEAGRLARLMLALGVVLAIEHLPAIAARLRLNTADSGLFGALYNLRGAVWPFALAISLPLYAHVVSGKAEERLLKKALFLVALLAVGFLAAAVFMPQLIFLILYGEAFLEGAPYMAVYGVSLAVQMVMMVLIFYESAAGTISPRRLVWPFVCLAGGILFLGTSVPGLIAAQILAAAAYLVTAARTLRFPRQPT
jgi:O-antigen/teichoic acid export membrane protein